MSDSLDTPTPGPCPRPRSDPYDASRPAVHRRADAAAADRFRPQRGHLCGHAEGGCARPGRGRLDLGGRRSCSSASPPARRGPCSASGTLLIGLWLLHFRGTRWPQVAPFAAAGDQPAPLRVKTAIFMTVRNEDPERAILRLEDRESQCRRHRGRRRLQLLRAERYQRSGSRGGRGGRRRRLEGRRSPIRDRIVYRRRHRQHRLQGRQRARLLRPLGQGLRPDAAARRRQPDVGRPDRAAGAHDAGPSQDRHPAEPGGRHAFGQRVSRASSSSACATACAPTPWARPGGWATAGRSGVTTRWCASSRSTSSATCRCCPANRRSVATSSPTTRSRPP